MLDQTSRPARTQPRAPSERRDWAAYILVLCATLGFLIVTGYLMNQSVATSQRLTLSWFKEEADREISVQQAHDALTAGKFSKAPGHTGELDLGYLREGVWVLLEFKNPQGSQTSEYVLQLRHTYINGSITELVGGTPADGFATATRAPTQTFTDKLLPRSQRLNDVRHVSFAVKVEPGSTYRALVRLRAHVMNVPFLMLEERSFLSSVIREIVPLASLFGGLLLLALYNAMVGLARREPEFIFYGLYVAAIALMASSINGTGHMFLWPDVLWLHYNSANLLINIVCLSYLGFTYSVFLRTPLIGLERIAWQVVVGACALGVFLQLVEGGLFASIQANSVPLATLILGLVRAWRARKDYGRIANLFILSEGVLFAGAAAYCLKMFGWLPPTTFTLNIVLLAATLEAILLSFVLSEKMRRTMGEKELALRQLEIAHAQLEESVRDKTLAMAARYTSHEVLNPVFAVRLKAERIREEALLALQNQSMAMPRFAHQVTLKAEEIFKLIDSIIQTIRAIKSMSSDGERDSVAAVDLEEAFRDAVQMLEVKTLKAGCMLQSDFSAGRWVRARRTDVVQVLVNLISNSLDAATGSPHSWIRVETRLCSEAFANSGERALEISVLDSGSGPAPEIRERLFDTHFTTKGVESGMGLGLSLCQRLVERNAGSIRFDSQREVTSFTFTLPFAQESTQPTVGVETTGENQAA